MSTQVLYSPTEFFNLFGVDYEKSQLKTIMADLDLNQNLNAWVAGGALVRTLIGQDIFKGDIDIWAADQRAFDILKSRFEKEKTFVKTKYACGFEYKMGIRKTIVQLIIKDEPTAIVPTIHDFDFHHCKFAISNIKACPYVVTTEAALVALAQRKVLLSNVRDATYSLGRALKYKKLGFDADEAIDVLAAMIMKDKKCGRVLKYDNRFGDYDGDPLSDVTAMEIDLGSVLAKS